MDVPLADWMLVESAMYLSAACLIGLRPLLSKSSRWFRTQISMFGFKALWRRTRSGNDHRDDMSSMIQILNANVDGGRSPGQDTESGRGHSVGSRDIHAFSV